MSNNQKQLLVVNDWQKEQMTLSKTLGIDLNAQREHLKDALLRFEENNKGFNLVGSKVYEFLRHIQNIVWKQLAELKRSNPTEYAEWASGIRGYWPLETNNTSHGTLLRLSEARRLEIDATQPGEAAPFSGHSKSTDNIRRTVLNWRRKTTESWICKDGSVVKGFPFFMGWTRLNRVGDVDPNGRGNVIGLVNLNWVFGPEWPDFQKNQNIDIQGVAVEDTEKFSTIPHHIQSAVTSLTENIEENAVFAALTTSGKSKTGYCPSDSIESARKQGATTSGMASEEILPQKISGPGAAPGGVAGAKAAELWAFLIKMLYLPLFGTGRIRFSANFAYSKAGFSDYCQEKSIELLIQNIHAATETGEISLENACARLKRAIEKQAKYLQDNPSAWIHTPEKFLRTGKKAGTLQSAVRIFLPSEIVKNNVLTVENDGHKARKNRLYAQLIDQGAKTHFGTFSSWVRKFGLDHLEACINYLLQQSARRRNAGKRLGQEYDSRVGGVTAYFAGLVTRLDTTAIAEEARQIQRDQLKRQLWAIAAQIEAERHDMSPEIAAQYDALCYLYQQLNENQEMCDIALADTQAYFGMTITELKRLSNLILIQYVLHGTGTNKNDEQAPEMA